LKLPIIFVGSKFRLVRETVHILSRSSVIAGLIVGTLWAQQSLPTSATNARLVRLRVGNSCGWCTENYNEFETTVERGRIVITNRSDSDRKKYPDLTVQYRITKRDWRDLERLIDAKLLASFPKPSSDCPGCADEPVAWVELQFSDGTKKSLVYVGGADPSPVVELKQRIDDMESKAALRPR
jgi:hypothetical protein